MRCGHHPASYRRVAAAGAVILWFAWGASLEGETAAPSRETAQDVKVVRQRVVETLVPPGGPAPISEREARGLLDALASDGRWPDIDYANQGRSNWEPGGHVRRALQLAACWRTPGHALCGKADVRDKIHRALRWWISNDLQCPNWWWNDIGVPEALGRTLILLGDDFPADLMPGAAKILKRAERQDMTGQNTLWVCGVRVTRGCVENSPDLVAAAFKRAAAEIKISAGEGVQPDFSFHQHGALLYSGGYGRGYAAYGPMFARLAAGTAFALPPEKVRILSAYLLDGEQWMIRGDRFDPSCTGREITRRGHSAASLAQACRDLAALDAARRGELEAFARRLRGEKDAPPLVGNRHFWRSDFLVHHRSDWYASVRMFSSRIYNSELVNGEGRKSHHLADGVMLVLRTGREFDAMPPVWDWKRLPGTTCEQGSLPDPVKQKGGTSFVGGVSDGMYGAAAMDLKRGPLSAKKAWVFFDDCLVALGAGITCTSDNRVLTSIDQRPLRGDVRVSRGGEAAPVPRGERAVEEDARVLHDAIGYSAAKTPGVRLRADVQTGSWRDISDPAPAAPVSADVFSLWIDHGLRPSGAAYCYVVTPAMGDAAKGQVAATALSNSPDLQAAYDPGRGVTGAIFWKAGALAPPEGPSIEVDRPCLVLLRRQAGGVRLAVANPEAKPLDVTVRVGLGLDGEGCAWLAEDKCTAVKFSLPGGGEAGRSIVRELKSRKP